MKTPSNSVRAFVLSILAWCLFVSMTNVFMSPKGNGGDTEAKMSEEIVATITAERVNGEVKWTFQLNEQYYSSSCALAINLMEALKEDCGEDLK